MGAKTTAAADAADASKKDASKIPKQRPADGPKFEYLQPPLRAESLAVLRQQGFERATPVQAATIGLLAGNKDVAVEACTGSGKTLAFVLPMIEILARAETPFRKHSVGGIIVSPTRELAKQIYDVCVPFLESVSKETCKAGAMLLVGGTDVALDVATFYQNGAVALIGTPGRLDDIMVRSKALCLKRVELLILDEADRLLSMGFVKTLNNIILRLPKQRRTGLFSATQTEETEELARAGLRNPVRVTVRDAASQAAAAAAREAGAPASSAAARGKLPAQLELSYKICNVDERLWHLRAFLRGDLPKTETSSSGTVTTPGVLSRHARNKKVIAYFLTCACVDYFATALEPGGPAEVKGHCEVITLHGKMKQSQREAALTKFAESKNGAVLLCTDVAARGLDIPGVDWVVQFDAPQDPAAFVHRVGRTARMGRPGAALIYLAPHEASYVEFLLVRHIKVNPFDGEKGKVVVEKKVVEEALEGDDEDENEDDASESEDQDDLVGSEDGDEGETDEEGGGAEEEEEEEEEESVDDESDEEIDEAALSGAQALNIGLRTHAERNREAMEKGTRAFVSYMRGYKEHHCRFIFRHKELHLTKLANAMGLMRLPRMKEIRKAPKHLTSGFVESSVNPDSVPYHEKAREKARKIANAVLAKEKADAVLNGTATESSGKAAREKKKREDAVKEVERLRLEKRQTATKRRQQEFREDVDDINDDYRALKKLKKGKISEEEFELELGFEQPLGGGRDGKDYVKAADRDGGRNTLEQYNKGASRLQGAALKAADKKVKPSKPKHLKNSKAKGGGKGAKALKKKKFNK